MGCDFFLHLCRTCCSLVVSVINELNRETAESKNKHVKTVVEKWQADVHILSPSVRTTELRPVKSIKQIKVWWSCCWSFWPTGRCRCRCRPSLLIITEDVMTDDSCSDQLVKNNPASYKLYLHKDKIQTQSVHSTFVTVSRFSINIIRICWHWHCWHWAYRLKKGFLIFK